MKLLKSFIISFALMGSFSAQERPILDIMLTNYQYPYEVQFLNFKSQNDNLTMAYMDIQPKKFNGKTVVLLHGKNFNGAYWKTTIQDLSKEGYRIVVPDQIGFGKSSKPADYQFTFQQLAQNTKTVLDHLKIEKISLLGHSMGGMLATRFTLMYPEMVEKLILENPIGLEDWKTFAPYTNIDQNYQNELKADYESTKKFTKTAFIMTINGNLNMMNGCIF